MGFDAQQSRWIGKHRVRIGLSESLAAQQVEEHLRMASAHVGLTFVLGWPKAEIAPSLDHLLGRASADSKLQTSASNKVRRPGVLDHVEWVLVSHVDDGRADFDTACLRAYGCEQREGRRELSGEVVDAEIGSVRAKGLGRNREIDGLHERIRC